MLEMKTKGGTIVTVPENMREQMEGRGFSVVAASKKPARRGGGGKLGDTRAPSTGNAGSTRSSES